VSDQRLSFTFEKCLGQGGFGEVYLASLNRPGGLTKRVAVKVLKEDLRHADAAVQRLRDEGRMLAILDHPCILRVIEMTLIRGRVALVTEYIDGVDLARCCRKPYLLPQTVVLGAMGEVASALHTAWTTPSPETGKPLKLIHRDIKPENIRIGKHGEIKLLDFGIARTTEMFRHAKTAQGDLPFTPGYAAPEAFTKGFQGSASDVYALGVTMFRLLAGERLYEDMELSDQVTICCLPERYSSFLKKRLMAVDAPEPVMALLRDMLAYDAPHRPSAFEVENRCNTLVDSLDGPSHVRWARAQTFPEPQGLPDGSLTGETIEEDDLEARKAKGPRGTRLKPRSGESARGLLDRRDAPPRPQAQQKRPNAVADLTPPFRTEGAQASNRTPSTPPVAPPMDPDTVAPPVPSGLHTVKPTTGPFQRPVPTGELGPALRDITQGDRRDGLDPSDVPPDFSAPSTNTAVPPESLANASAASTVDIDVADPDAPLEPVDQAATLDALFVDPKTLDIERRTVDDDGAADPFTDDGPDQRPAPKSMPPRDLPTSGRSLVPSTPRDVTPKPVPESSALAATIDAPAPPEPRSSGVLTFAFTAIALGVLVGGGVVMVAGLGLGLVVWLF
jgi:serine/threonine protein kinase